MTEESSAMSHLAVAMTTADVPDITSGNTMKSSTGFNYKLYFECAVVILGVIGTAANALILYALVASRQHKKHVLIVNQNALDLFSSVFLAITYAVKLCNIRLTGSLGYWLCMMIFSENLIWVGFFGSVISLAIVTVDRYLKVVHSVWSKKKLRNWMIYLAMAFPWIGSIVNVEATVLTTSYVVNGKCYVYAFGENDAAKLFHFFWHFLIYYVFVLLLFIFCYGHILIVIRRQARVMAAHGAAGSSTAQAQSNQIQSNVIKTMIIVCASYAISQSPKYIVVFLTSLIPNSAGVNPGFFTAAVFVAFMYISVNPFIYAAKFYPVKQVLLGLIPCKKTSSQASVNVAIT